MSALRTLTAGLKALFGMERRNAELDEELRGFLHDSVDEKMRRGMSREERVLLEEFKIARARRTGRAEDKFGGY